MSKVEVYVNFIHLATVVPTKQSS